MTGGRRRLPPGPALAEPEFDRLFATLADLGGPVLAAVSGGPDSIALMHALARWAETPGRPAIRVATVDHGTRPETRAEAEGVARMAMRLGLAHDILADPGSTPRSHSGLRALRYRLLDAHARRIDAGGLVTAHTIDDQAETVLMRLASGSGIAGLAGMRHVTMRGGLAHVRPLLAVEKVRLVATCRERGWPFVEDPGNADPRFARARWRALAPLLAAEGLDARCLARLAERARRADEGLGAAARAALARANLADTEGTLAALGNAVASDDPMVPTPKPFPQGQGDRVRSSRPHPEVPAERASKEASRGRPGACFEAELRSVPQHEDRERLSNDLKRLPFPQKGGETDPPLGKGAPNDMPVRGSAASEDCARGRHPRLVIRLRGRMLAAEPDEIALRVLALALARNEGSAPPNLARLERCWVSLKAALSAGLPLRRTLAGHLLTLDREGTISLSPEGPRRRGQGRINDDAAAPPHSLGISRIGA